MSTALPPPTTTLNMSNMMEEFSAFDQFLIDHLTYFDKALYVIYSLIFLLGITGNIIVIYVLISSICINKKYPLNSIFYTL